MREEYAREVLFIAVTDEDGSNNRKYSDSILHFCDVGLNENINPGEKYLISRHDMIVNGSNLKQSLFEKIARTMDFIILLDQYEDGFCPNVWFELGLISTILDAKLTCIAKHDTEIPFDLGSEVEVVRISKELKELLESQFKQNSFNARSAFSRQNNTVIEFQTAIKDAFINSTNPFSHIYEHSQLKQHYGFDSFSRFMEEIGVRDFFDGDNARVQYIDGEQNAFEELTKAVSRAQHSLRTSRFANQSIVVKEMDSNNEIREAHKHFMNALKEASYRIDGKFERIICINSAEKWHDVYTALSDFCPKKTVVYLRRSEFSIKFELVIIDEEVSFIHFYLADDPENMKDKPERIRSTLKIRGSKISKKLSDIFDRLHHRDYNAIECIDLSRTLLGVEEDHEGDLTEESKQRGYLRLDKSNECYNKIPNTGLQQQAKSTDALNKIKEVLNWKLSEYEKKSLKDFFEVIE